MKCTLVLSSILAAAALTTLGGCCQYYGLDSSQDALCCVSWNHPQAAEPDFYAHEGMMNGKHGWYDTRAVFHEGKYQATMAPNIGYYDASGRWVGNFDVNTGPVSGYYDGAGIWHAGSAN